MELFENRLVFVRQNDVTREYSVLKRITGRRLLAFLRNWSPRTLAVLPIGVDLARGRHRAHPSLYASIFSVAGCVRT